MSLRAKNLLPIYEESDGLSKAQVSAIRKQQELGEILADQHPDIANDYRNDLNQREIALKYRLLLGDNIVTARNAVGFALRKLIPADELARLQKIKFSHNGKKNLQENKGIFGLSQEIRREIGRKSGQKTYELKLGIHGLSQEQRRKILLERIASGKMPSTEDFARQGRKMFEEKKGCFGLGKEERKLVVRKTNFSLGRIPWEDCAYDVVTGLDEYHYCLMLLGHPKFQGKCVRVKGALDAIANELNQIFHRGEKVRDGISVNSFSYRLKT